MTPENKNPLDRLWEALPKIAYRAGYEAGREHLRAGRPIFYDDPAYPDGTVKEYPDGRKDIVKLKRGGYDLIRTIPASGQ